MASILFIGEQYLKEKTVLSNNIDINLIVPNIEYSQDAYIQPLLGSKFYNSLQESYSAETLSSDEITLMNLIKPALAYRSAEASLPFINLQIRNKGINKLNSENAVQADLSEMKYLRDTLKSRAEFYESKIQDYLIKNGTLFPNYINPDTPIQPNQGSTFTCDLYLSPSSATCNCGNLHCSICGC